MHNLLLIWHEPLAIIFGFLAFYNYGYWAVYHDSWNYIYDRKHCGWWTLFYIIMASTMMAIG